MTGRKRKKGYRTWGDQQPMESISMANMLTKILREAIAETKWFVCLSALKKFHHIMWNVT